MAVTIENLGQLKRKIELVFKQEDIATAVNDRLKNLSKTVRMSGFRPGKIPLKLIERRYGDQVRFEAQFDRAYRLFTDLAKDQGIRVVGQPQLIPKDNPADGLIAFDATFETYPTIELPDNFQDMKFVRLSAEITDAEIDKTIDIMRSQQRQFFERGQAHEVGTGGDDVSAQNGDQVTVDFEGKLEGEPFKGGSAKDFSFIIGDGRMLAEFDEGVKGLKAGESRSFPLTFPEEYNNKDLAGKTVEFNVTVKSVKFPFDPELTAEIIKQYGVPDGSLERLRAEIRGNLEREMKRRIRDDLKQQVMDALDKKITIDVPEQLVEQDRQRLIEMTKQEWRARGMKDVEKIPFPDDAFKEQALRRVKLGLIINEIVNQKKLQANSDQVRLEIEDIAQSYEEPEDAKRWYYEDRERLMEVGAVVTENNVMSYILSTAVVEEKQLTFEELTAKVNKQNVG